jgi:putative glutamine amidotransferase
MARFSVSTNCPSEEMNQSTGKRRPVIGVCARVTQVTLHTFERVVSLTMQDYVDPIAAAGCTPVLLPLLPGVEDAADSLDGLLLPGGRDIAPVMYGQAAHPQTNPKADPVEDGAELALLERALNARLPVLGICRGMELLNVLRGGTLIQCLPEVVGHTDHQPQRGQYGTQSLKLQPGSRIAEILGESAQVPCHHHQAADRLGFGLSATAWAADGTIEAIEATDLPFVVGVQWHADQASDARPFEALAAAARAR